MEPVAPNESTVCQNCTALSNTCSMFLSRSYNSNTIKHQMESSYLTKVMKLFIRYINCGEQNQFKVDLKLQNIAKKTETLPLTEDGTRSLLIPQN